MKSMYRYLTKIYLLLLICFPSALYAQDSSSVAARENMVTKKSKPRFSPTSFRFGIDVVPLAANILYKNQKKYEATVELGINSMYYISLSGGSGSYEQIGNDYVYKSNGTYARIGIDYNFWHLNKSKADGFLMLGLHYGRSFFKHNLDASVGSNYWQGNQTVEENFSGLNANWLMIQGRLQGKIFKNFIMGPLIRIKFLVSSTPSESLEINSIPGYGLKQGAGIEVGYHILYQLDFTK
jgi:hypothetical protein